MPKTKAPRLTADSARRMLAEGMPLRQVLAAAGVRQVQLANDLKTPAARVSRILGSAKWARKDGRELAERVYRLAARKVGVVFPAEVPEWSVVFPPAEQVQNT